VEFTKKKEIIQYVTLNDLDSANARPVCRDSTLSIVGSIIKSKKTEITEKLRQEINKIVYKYEEQGNAELLPGVLFIDEAHMMDIECFAFLNRALESSLTPIVIFATNRGICQIRGTDITSPHGIPIDLLDRLVIIQTLSYQLKEIFQILSVRAKVEKINIDEDSIHYLAELGVVTSLRHASQLITPAMILAKSRNSQIIQRLDVKNANMLFQDAKTSAYLLAELADKYIL
jgi:RuvB-like protein 1 (pontin 52)